MTPRSPGPQFFIIFVCVAVYHLKLLRSHDIHVQQRKRIPQTWSLLPCLYMLQMLGMMGTRCQILHDIPLLFERGPVRAQNGTALSLSLPNIHVIFSSFFLSSFSFVPHKVSLFCSNIPTCLNLLLSLRLSSISPYSLIYWPFSLLCLYCPLLKNSQSTFLVSNLRYSMS